MDIADSTWNVVHSGMRKVISDGSAKKIFSDLEVDIAGKTGTAEELKNGHIIKPCLLRVLCALPGSGDRCDRQHSYGYSSSNAATAANIYRYYYGYTDLDYILNNSALNVSNVEIGD